MIDIKNLNEAVPYKNFYSLYQESSKLNPKNIEAILIASMDKENDEVDARFVNLKFILNDKWIFFTNYESPKSIQFNSNNKITAVLFWSNINVQIRIKAHIEKTSLAFNKKYFLNRALEKNALAISSNQSEIVKSFDIVEDKYYEALNSGNLKECPSYWGGYSFTPYYFEFWQGNESRLNKRDIYKLEGVEWSNYLLQP
tara:strand:+ start:262 stop:858 length:597 start_codon:yes stop_codon:yes gene_type:complete